MNEEPINLEDAQAFPEYYPALNHAMSAPLAVPFIRDITYFKLQTLRNADSIVDVYPEQTTETL